MPGVNFLVFIAQGTSIRRASTRVPRPVAPMIASQIIPDAEPSHDDAYHLKLFSRILSGQHKPSDQLSDVLAQGMNMIWEDVYDFVNPFGDHRERKFDSVWTFDLDKDVLFLRKEDRLCSAPLGLARRRPLTLDDFEPLNLTEQTHQEHQTLPGPYWEPHFDPLPRQRSFLGRVLRDFFYTWRHVLRRQMKTKTFIKLAYATIWIARMEFTIKERIRSDHITSSVKPYVQLTELPSWETPKATLVQAGSSWFALAQDTQEGLEIVRCHMKSHPLPKDSITTYAILTLRRVTLCKAQGGELVWTRSETLFDGTYSYDIGIDMLLWATNINKTDPQPIRIDVLPPEIQDRILRSATTSLVASAKLGCELGLGSVFSWLDGGVKISLEEVKRHRLASSPVGSQVMFNGGVMSGVSYMREFEYREKRILPPLPPLWQT